MTSILESARPLSQSAIWHRQRDYYTSQSTGAFGSGPVPYYVTTNPMIARCYARMAMAYLQDLATAGSLDRSHPFYIVELGAGSGRFSFHFRRELDALLALAGLDLHVVLVMTDLVAANLDHWQARPELQDWFARGQIDLAQFDVERDEKLYLRISNRILAPGRAVNPMMFIANYVFDGTPQDVFLCNNGKIEEFLAVLHKDEAEGCKLTFTRRAIAADHYPSREMNSLLASCGKDFSGTLSMPVAALSCLSRLQYLSGGRMFLLASDKGYGHRGASSNAAPTLATHGSYSMMVNFGALGRWVHARGGQDWHPTHRPAGLYVAAFAFGLPHSPQCDQAYAQSINQNGPDEVWSLKAAAEHLTADMKFDHALAYARLANFDSAVVAHLLPAWSAQLDSASPEQRASLAAIIAQIDESYFPIGESFDLAFDLGVLLLRMEHYQRAAAQFQKSLQRFGQDASALINLALCLHRLNRPHEAQPLLNQGLALDPTNQTGLMLQRCIGWSLMIA